MRKSGSPSRSDRAERAAHPGEAAPLGRALVQVSSVRAHELDPLLEAFEALGAEVELVDGAEGLELVGVLKVAPRREALIQELAVDPRRVRVEAIEGADWGSVVSVPGRVLWFGPLRVQIERGRDGGAPDEPADPSTLFIEERGAFGTGLHPTTALLLDLIVERRPRSLLDVGTGSGILALAALRLGARVAVGTDVDPAALEAARRNAQRNAMPDETFILSAEPPDALGHPFRWVCANVLAAELEALAPSLVRALAPEGFLWLSGIRSSAADEVARVFEGLGLRRGSHWSRAGWCAVELLTSW